MISLIENRQINIKDFVHLGPEKTDIKHIFNISKYLESLSLDKIKSLVETNKDKIQWLDELFQVKIAAPELFENLVISNLERESLKTAIKIRRNPQEWLESERLLANTLLVFPEHREYFQGHHDGSKLLIDEINWIRENRKVTLFDAFDPYFYLAVNYPEKAQSIKFTKIEKENLKIYAGTKFKINGDEPINLRTTAQTRIMFPKEPKLYKISDEENTRMLSDFEERAGKSDTTASTGKLHKFLVDLASMKIINADEVKFTREKGLEVIPQNRFAHIENITIPNFRKF
jgi:hypothetical protein